MYEWDFGFLWKYRTLLIGGIGYTLLFTVICVIGGLIVGLAAGMGRLSSHKFVSVPLRAFVEVFRCTPVLVQLVWFYYALPVLTGIEMSAPVAAALCLSLYGGAFYSEIIRGGIISTDIGQTEAGQAIGMTRFQVMRRIILPQAFRKMIPPLVNQSILQLKNTSLVSVISMTELFRATDNLMQSNFRVLEALTVATIYYLGLTAIWTILQNAFERRNSRWFAETGRPARTGAVA